MINQKISTIAKYLDFNLFCHIKKKRKRTKCSHLQSSKDTYDYKMT